MPLSLNVEAGRRFDELADQTLSLAKAEPPFRASSPAAAVPDERDIRMLAASDIDRESFRAGVVDLDGRNTKLSITVGEEGYAIEGEGIRRFEQLLTLVRRQRKLCDAVGAVGLGMMGHDWLHARLNRTDSKSFSDWLLDRINSILELRTIVVPLESLRIESPFEFGGVRFDAMAITKAMLDTIESGWIAAQPDQELEIRMACKRDRFRFQGQTCAVASVEADPQWAHQSASDKVERVLSVLRLFSPSAFHPGIKCAVGRVGRVFVPADVSCELKEGSPASITDSAEAGYAQSQWSLSNKKREELMAVGMSELESLLVTDTSTELDEAVLEAVRLLDESVRCNDLAQRVTLALIAAESLFIQNDSEPTQVMLAIRCARLVGRDALHRERINRIIKRAYEFRSRYVHHGSANPDHDLLSELHCVFLDAFVAVRRLPQAVRTRAALAGHLQMLIWN